LTEERDQMLSDAHAEAQRILAAAEAEATDRVSEHVLVRTAEARAADIEERALQQAEQVRRDAEAYAYRVLEKLRDQISQVGQTVNRGLQELDARADRAVSTP
jgi:vacuolar-type H+-ATPase subunit H